MASTKLFTSPTIQTKPTPLEWITKGLKKKPPKAEAWMVQATDLTNYRKFWIKNFQI